jgi:hypothetical protein
MLVNFFLLFGGLFLYSIVGFGQVEGWQITSEDTPYTIDFDSTEPNVNEGQFDGSGFSPTPNVGQLHSRSWSVTGFGDGDLDFGDINTSGDFARGLSTGGVGTGGIYAFETSSGNFALGIQPSGSDFTPGEFILKIQNKTGVDVNAVKLRYLISVFNDQDRGNSLNFSYSIDGNTYIEIPALDVSSPDAAEASPGWQSNTRETTITGLSIPDDGFFYFKWTGDDVSGAGNRDEFALDDMTIRVNPIIPLITVSESSMSNLNYEPGNGPSTSQLFLVSGENLVNNITVSIDTASNFEISLDDINFSNQVIVNEISGTVTESPIHVRLKSGLVEGNFSDEIVLSSTSADSQFVKLNGRVKEGLELFITEIANPADVGNAKYIELFNAGVEALDLSAVNYQFAIQFNGGTSLDYAELSGIIPAKGYYIIESGLNTGYEDNYTVASDFQINSTLGNGNDSYILSTSGLNDQDVIDTMFDIYGEIGRDGATEIWNYTDSRVYRNNPTVTQSNIVWDNTEWQIIPSPTTPTDMTPGYGDKDYVYVDDTNEWAEIGLGNPIGNSTTDQNTFVRSGSVTLTGEIAVGDLVVRSGARLSLSPDVKLSVSGDIVNEGTIIFESNATSTAVLEAVQPNTRVVGNGFEIHRRIPIINGHRAYRYLSASVDTQNSAKPYVFDNWQEGGLNPGDAGYQANLGTHITGSSSGANGFDASPSGNPSMFSWDNTGQTWNSIGNTDNTSFSAADAYAILIRGDRSSPLNTNDQTGPSTTLRTTGRIHVGDFDVSGLSPTDGHFNLVGNPYQSQVDLDTLMSSSTDLNQNFVYVWDPTLGSLGGYAVIDFDLLPVVNTIIDFGASTPSNSDANQFLQPQQAFFVNSTGPNTDLTFTEAMKDNTGTQTTVFSDGNSTISILDINLKGEDNLTYDGVRLVYGNTYSNTVDNLDAIKLWNAVNLITIANANSYLAVEKRDLPQSDEVNQFQLYNLAGSSFSLELNYFNDDPNPFALYLKDQYLNVITPILPDTESTYNFSIDQTIPDSFEVNRFQIVYNNTSLSDAQFNEHYTVNTYPNPLTTSEAYISIGGLQLDHTPKIELYNLAGKQVDAIIEAKIVNDAKIKITFDRAIQNGTYVIHINSKKSSLVDKIIINR